MASRHEQFIQQQRKKAEQIRESALNGTLKRDSSTKSITSRSDAYRASVINKSQETKPGTFGTPMKELQQNYGAVTPTNMINTFMTDTQRQQQSKSQPQTQLTEYDVRMKELNESNYPAPVKGFAKFMTEALYGNPVGNFISRAGHQADNVLSGGNPVTIQPDTGSKVANIAADIGGSVMSVFTPTGAPINTGPIAGTYSVTDNLLTSQAGQKAEQALVNQVSKVLKPQTAQALTREGLREGAAGAMQGTAYGLMTNQDGEGVLKETLLGGGIGGTLGVGLKAAGIGISKLLKNNGIPENEIAEILALPEGKLDSRMSAASERSVLQAGTEPIVNPYTFELPEASIATKSAASNANEGRTAIQQIDNTLNDLTSKYEQRVIDEYKYLKESRDSRSGVQQGSLQRDVTGDVIDRTGRISENPLWYQEFYRKNNKVPSNKDLYELARERVDNGFMDEVGQVPSWKTENNYDSQIEGLMAVRETLQNSVRELDPALNVVDQPLVTQELKDTRANPSASRKRNGSVPYEPVQPGTTTLEPRRQEIRDRLETGGSLTSEDIDFILNSDTTRIEPEVPKPLPKVNPNVDPILNPSQFEEHSGLGISAFAKTKPYDSLSNTTRSQLVTRLDREPVSFAGLSDRLYTNVVDDFHPLNQFDKLVEDVLEKPLTSSQSTHKLALSTRGADMTARQIVTDALVDSQGNVIGESLKDILSGLPRTSKGLVNSSTKSQIRKVSKDIYVDFEDYLINKHAITRAERGETVFDKKLNWTPEYGAQKVTEYEKMFPEFKETAEKLYEFNRQMVNSWLVDTGIISPNMAKAWFDANPFYVPNKRYFSTMEKRGGGVSRSKQGFGNQSNPVKKYGATGSERKIVSPIEAMIENVDSFVKTAKRNQVMQQAVNNIQADPEAFKDFMEVVVAPKGDENLIRLLLGEENIDGLIQSLDDDFMKLQGESLFQRTSLDKDNIVRVLMDGEQINVKVNDPQLLDAISALGPKAGNWVMDALGQLTNKMKTLTTGANPVFSLTRNIFRDIPHAYIASKTTNNPIRFVADMADAAIQILKDGDLYKQYKRIGGGHSSSIAANRNLLAQSKRSVLPKSLLKDLGPRLFYGLENAMNAVETAPRLGEFKRASKSGLGDDLKSALFEAQDLTVNFKRRGKMINELDKIFPYMNAAIQGIDQVVRLYKNNPKQATIKAFLSLSVPGAVMYAINHDDPNYQKVSNRVKDNFLLIPKGDGTFFKIAKPKELGTLFIDLPERLMQKFAKDDPAAFRDFADQLRTNFLPPGISGVMKSGGLTDRALGVAGETILGPIADLAANETFSGSPIVPGYLENLSPGFQADAKTTDLSRWIGEKTQGTPFEQSPKKLDYLARQYTGVLGQLVQPLLSPGGDLSSTLTQQVTADPVFSNDISTEFYHYKSKLDQAYNDRDLKEVPDWYSDPLRKRLNKLSQNMSAVRKEIRTVQGDTNLSNKEKREKLRELQERINNIAETGNSLARDVVPY